MRGWKWLLIAAFLGGCAEQEQSASESAANELLASWPGLTDACVARVRRGDQFAVHDRDCHRMLPPRRWKGLWAAGFEWSNFCPAPARDCPIAADRGDIWLEIGEGVEEQLLTGDDGLFAIEFVGRRTEVPGRHGHLNQYDHLMIVDRLISVRNVPEAKK